jgi:hypothetical protein
MNVSLLNYENYILDFLEGSLPSKNQVLFLQFLQEHPFIQKEIQGLMNEEFRLQPSQTIDFSEKRFLKKRTAKQISLAEKHEMCFLYQQNQLSPAEEIQFKLLLKEDIELQKFLQQEMEANLLDDAHIFGKKKDKFLFPIIGTEKRNKNSTWLYFLFFSLSWVFTGIFCFLFLKQYFFFQKDTNSLEFTPVTTEQVPITLTTLPNTIQPTTVLKNKVKKTKPIASVRIKQPSVELISEPQEQLALLEDIPALPTLAQTENEAKSSSRQHTFDFSTEKKAVKSIFGIILFSIKKAKDDEY